MLIAQANEIGIFDLTSEEYAVLATNTEFKDLKNLRFNDAKADPTGRVYVGTYQIEGKVEDTNALWSLDIDVNTGNYTFTKRIDNIGNANGMAFDEASKSMYFIDTHRKSLDRYSWDGNTGTVTKVKTVKTFSNNYPDNIVMDRDGFIWVCVFMDGACYKIDPNTGDELGKIVSLLQ